MVPRCKFCGRNVQLNQGQHRAGLFYKRGNGGMIYTGPGDHCQYFAWSTGGDAGISSKTIVEALTGASVLGSTFPGAPVDAGDFGRCLRMLERFHWLRAGLHQMPTLKSCWQQALTDAWPELEQLHAAGMAADPIAVGAGVLPALDARLRELLS